MNTINGHEALNQYWYNVELALQMYTYDELLINLKRLKVIENVEFVQSQTYFSFYSSVTQQTSDVETMLVHCLQRWPNNVPRLVMNVSMGIIEFMFL